MTESSMCGEVEGHSLTAAGKGGIRLKADVGAGLELATVAMSFFPVTLKV